MIIEDSMDDGHSWLFYWQQLLVVTDSLCCPRVDANVYDIHYTFVNPSLVVQYVDDDDYDYGDYDSLYLLLLPLHYDDDVRA